MNKILLLLFPLFVFSQNQDNKILIIEPQEDLFAVFYNLENLFDTINNPNTNDEAFLPESDKSWNTDRYSQKILQLNTVFNSMQKDLNNNQMPNIIGLCEVENKLVIEDLLKGPVFADKNYTIIHQDSPDSRGIDCALLFDNKFQILNYEFIAIDNPEANRSTRDIVYVKLKFKNEVINVFVNHWPSRWGGQEETNHKRVFASKVLRDYINLHIQESEYTLIMGDFNDYPDNESVSEILVKNDYINIMSTDLVSEKGSYNYKGYWNWLDQIIVSKNFISSNTKILSAGAFQKDFMMYINSEGEKYPSRTFGGSNWYGGFSDHLPIYCKIGFLYN